MTDCQNCEGEGGLWSGPNCGAACDSCGGCYDMVDCGDCGGTGEQPGCTECGQAKCECDWQMDNRPKSTTCPRCLVTGDPDETTCDCRGGQ